MDINFDLYKPEDGHVLVLKSLPADMVAARNHVSGGFKWPESGTVSAPDWRAVRECGNGLHGWKWGVGDSNLRVKDDDAKWLILSVEESTIIDLEDKVKFPTCEILYLGDRETSVKILQNFAPGGTPIMFSTVSGGNRATVTGGDGATVTGGDRATVTGGDGATVTGGDRATVTGGDGATVTGGDRATVTGGYRATVTGGYGALLMFRWQEWSSEKGYEWKRKMALVDGVNYMPGVKYRLIDDEIVPAPDQNEGE